MLARWLPVLVLPLTGCAALSELLRGVDLGAYTPQVHLSGVDLQELDWDGATAEFVFHVENPNPVSVKVARFSYDLEVAGRSFLAGSDTDGLVLQAKGDSELRLPVGLVFADLLATAVEVAQDDTVPFRLEGSFGFDTPVGPIDVRYQEDGALPVLQSPRVRFQELRLGQLDLVRQTARLELDLGLENEQRGTALGFSGLRYGVDLGGARVASGEVTRVAEVAGGATETVTLPLDLKLLELAKAVVDAVVAKERLAVGVEAGVTVATPWGELPLSIDESGTLQVR